VETDALVIVTGGRARADWARVRDGMRTPVIVDGRNLLDPAATRAPSPTGDRASSADSEAASVEAAVAAADGES
jgi:hypothetical protein